MNPLHRVMREAMKNRQNPDLGLALLVAWTVRAEPGISKREILRRVWRPRPGQWEGVREVLQTGIVYRQAGVSKEGRGWYPTDRLDRVISNLEDSIGSCLPTPV